LITIGIENEGFSVDVCYSPTVYHATGDFSDWQYSANAWLVARAAKRWGFPIDRDHVIGHGEVYYAKAKLCPGLLVSLDRIVSEALAIDTATL
jgi:N-acetyl-anhydromuramyl-L-alanine amidase AmpD